MKKDCGKESTWTITRSICCSSISLNNPPSVFLGEKSCNQILIPKAQTRWWELESWRSLDYFPPLPLPLCEFLFLFLSLSLSLTLSLTLSIFLPFLSITLVFLSSSSSLHLVVGGLWCHETGEIDLQLRVKAHLKSMGLFSQLQTEKEGERVLKREEGK